MKKYVTFVVPAVLAVSLLATVAQADTSMTTSGSMMKDTSMHADSAMMMSKDLSYGSKGNEVITLQQWLVKKGFLALPMGVSTGYFGQLTKAALMKYQVSMGLPAQGYYGPLTRAKHASDDAMMSDNSHAMMNGSTSASMTHDSMQATTSMH